MATLHIINSSSLDNCLYAASPGDTVLLVGNGVYCAVDSVFARCETRKSARRVALAADVIAWHRSSHLESVQQIDDGAFVDLVVSHHPVVSWS
jgi:sulfur relay protein TusB/DsrH